MESDARDGMIEKMKRALEEQKHVNDVLSRQIDDLMFSQSLYVKQFKAVPTA